MHSPDRLVQGVASSAADNYARGLADGRARRPPDYDSLALGANTLNAYERGYLAAGSTGDERAGGGSDGQVA